MDDSKRNARVKICTNEKGRPSLKINGVEQNMLIGQEITLRHVPDDGLGHWELLVAFMHARPTVDVEADVQAASMATATSELRAANERLRKIEAAIARADKANRKGESQ